MANKSMRIVLAVAFLALGLGAAHAQQITATPPGACVAFGTTAGTCVQGAGAGGTPSSITLTNGTGLPLTTGVTGTLPVANGGTGLASLPKMAGTRITSSQTITGSTWTKVQINSVTLDTASYWDGTNYYYKPLVAGNYLACATILATGTTVTQLFTAISKNGTYSGSGAAVAKAQDTGLATATAQSVSAGCQIVAMNGSTDTLELDTYINGSGTLAADGTGGTVLLAIHLVP